MDNDCCHLSNRRAEEEHKLSAAEREEAMWDRIRARFEHVTDAKELVRFAAVYVVERHKKPILNRGDDGIFVRYLKAAQDHAQQLYCELRAGTLTGDQVVTALMPVAEIRTRLHLKGLPKQDADDAEDVANQALFFGVVEAMTVDVESFAGFLVVRIDGDVKDFVKKENNARRFVDSNGKEREVKTVDPESFWRRIDRRTSSQLAAVDSQDELAALAHDPIDATILQLRAEGHTDAAIAPAVGLSKSAVNARRRAMENRLDERLAVVAEDSVDEQIVALRAAGKNDVTIGRKLGISTATVIARHRSLERKYEERAEQLHTLLA